MSIEIKHRDTGAVLRVVDSDTLVGADLHGADLRWANLCEADLAWTNHDLVAEILRQAAGDDCERRQVSGLILVSRDWCWDQFLALDHPQRGWALRELAPWITAETPSQIRAAIDAAQEERQP